MMTKSDQGSQIEMGKQTLSKFAGIIITEKAKHIIHAYPATEYAKKPVPPNMQAKKVVTNTNHVRIGSFDRRSA